MPGLFDSFATGSGSGLGGGFLKNLGGGSGILSTKILNTRLKRIQTATTPQKKVQALVATLGMRFKPGGLIGGNTTSTTGTTTPTTATDAGRIWSSYQAGPSVRGLNIDFGNPDVQWG